MATRTAANPYMPAGNPYSQAQEAGAQTAPMPDDRNDGPANPPVAPAPVTTVQPTTTRPRTMPNGAPAPMSNSTSDTSSGTSTSDMPSPTASLVPIICHACGQRGIAPLAKIANDCSCACGSGDLDLDLSAEASADNGTCKDCGAPLEIPGGYGSKKDNGRCYACHFGRKWNKQDQKKKSSWETDMPMDTLHDTDSVAQPAKCSNCLQETLVTVGDPADPLPACPNCGAELLTAAGATLARRRRVAKPEPGEYGYEESDDYYNDREGNKDCPECGSKADEDGYCTEPGCPNQGKSVTSRRHAALPGDGGLGGAGLWATLVNMVNFARSSGDDHIPKWFMRFFKNLLLPEEIASGKWVTGGGGSYAWGTMGAKTAGGIVPSLVALGDGDFSTFSAEGVTITVEYHEEQAYGDAGTPAWGQTTGTFEFWWGDHESRSEQVTRVHVGPGNQAKRYQAEEIAQKFLDRVRSGRRYSTKEAAPYKGPPKMPKTPVTPGAGKGEDPEAARKKYERQQRRTEQERQWNTEGDERARKLIPDHFAQKVEEVTAGILATNPGMPPATARRVATETVRQYPKMLGSRG